VRVLADFQHLLAHDLRSPLNSLQLSLELLESSLSESADASGVDAAGVDAVPALSHQRHLKVIREELARLGRAVEQALEREEPMADVEERFDLRDVMAILVRVVKPRARRGAVALEVAACPEPLPVKAPKDRLLQALLNVVLEVLESQQEGDTVRLAASAMGTAIEIQVEGTHALSRPAPGGNDAMYVSKRFVAAHGGTLQAGRKETGARVSILLPRSTDAR
jgi:signal transduction histidine kinase